MLLEPHHRRATVNLYVRPRRTFSTVDADREEPGQADAANTRRPVHIEWLKLVPRERLATVLPSSRRLTTIFPARLGSLETIRRPVDRASAVPMETAYIRVRIRTNLHMQACFDFILYIISLGTRFWTSGALLLEHAVTVSPGVWLGVFDTEALDLVSFWEKANHSKTKPACVPFQVSNT